MSQSRIWQQLAFSKLLNSLTDLEIETKEDRYKDVDKFLESITNDKDKERYLNIIRNAYRKLSLKYHPDKSNDPNHISLFLKAKDANDFIVDYINNPSPPFDYLVLTGIRKLHKICDIPPRAH